MKKIVFFLFLFLACFWLPRNVYAFDPVKCPLKINGQPSNIPLIKPDELKFDFDFSAVANNFLTDKLKFSFPLIEEKLPISLKANLDGNHAFRTTKNLFLKGLGPHKVELLFEDGTKVCNLEDYLIINQRCSIKILPDRTPNWETDVRFEITDMDYPHKTLRLTGPVAPKTEEIGNQKDYTWPVGKLKAVGTYFIKVYGTLPSGWRPDSLVLCEDSFSVIRTGELTPTPTPIGSKPPPDRETHEICEIIKEAKARNECSKCFSKGNTWTALGCLPTSDSQEFIGWLLMFLIGIGGGVAFVLMLVGSFQVLTSSGNPEKIQAGKQLITSAIAGLLLIIFSLFLLQLIGVQILEIPGL